MDEKITLKDVLQQKKKITLKDVLQGSISGIRPYIDVDILAENETVFCVTNIEYIHKQWELTISVLCSDDTNREFLLVWVDDIQDKFMLTLQNALKHIHKNGMQALHGLKLTTEFKDNPFLTKYSIDSADSVCNCMYDK